MLAFLRSTKCCLCGCWCGRDAKVVEEDLHADAEALVVTVDAGRVGGLASQAGAADTGDERGDDLVAEGEKRRDRAGGAGRDAVTACVPGLDGQVLAPQLAQVVAALADGVAGLPAEPADCGGELCDGEPVGGGGPGERG